jgi:hypothetical protein
MDGQLLEIFEKFHYPGRVKFGEILKKLGIKASTREINEFVEKQPINQVFNEKRKVEGHIVSFEYMDRVQMDIIDLSKYKNTNGNISYILLVIDIFSRKLWGYAMKTKGIESVEKALNLFIKDNPPNIIISDNESSFMSAPIKTLFKTNNIKHITCEPGDHKVLGVIDRVCRTIKVNIIKYMTQNDTTKYIPHLKEIIDSYNDTPHSALDKMTPNEASEDENRQKVFELNLEKGMDNGDFNEFDIGETVRVRNKKKKFERAYDEKYSDVRTISDTGKRRVTLNDGTSVDMRRLKKVVVDDAKPLGDVVKKVEKENKIQKAIAREDLGIQNKKFAPQGKGGVSADNILEGKRVRKPKRFADE